MEITAHNHNFAVDPDSLNQSDVELTHVDLNDNTLEGLRHRNLPLFSVQYHPEAAPGPHDSHYLFRDFGKMMEEWKKCTRARLSRAAQAGRHHEPEQCHAETDIPRFSSSAPGRS